MSATFPERNGRAQKVRLSPPWVALQRTLSFSIGQSSQIMVSQLIGDSADYEVRLVTFTRETAQSLANVVKSSFSFGNVTVAVVVMDMDGNKYGPTERTPSVGDLKNTFVNNPLVYDVAEKKIACLPVVVQFWNDDISNPDGFTSMLSSDAFNEIVVGVVSAYTIGRKLINN